MLSSKSFSIPGNKRDLDFHPIINQPLYIRPTNDCGHPYFYLCSHCQKPPSRQNYHFIQNEEPLDLYIYVYFLVLCYGWCCMHNLNRFVWFVIGVVFTRDNGLWKDNMCIMCPKLTFVKFRFWILEPFS